MTVVSTEMVAIAVVADQYRDVTAKLWLLVDRISDELWLHSDCYTDKELALRVAHEEGCRRRARHFDRAFKTLS